RMATCIRWDLPSRPTPVPRWRSESRPCAPTRRSSSPSPCRTAFADVTPPPFRLLAVASLGLLAGCALRQAAMRPPELPAQARADPDRFVVITVRNDLQPAVAAPGSTPRGYTAAGVYGVSADARAITHSLERDYSLREVSAWPIESLRVNCIVVQ